MKSLPLTALLCVLCPWPAAAVPVINEFLAINSAAFPDDTGRTSDWIEIKNPGPGPVDLAGWSLTDEADNAAKWVFPSVILAEGDLLLVRASGLDRRQPGQTLHTNFTLSGGGGFLGLYSPQQGPASTVWQPYPRQFAGYSYGFSSGGAAQGYLEVPTPGADNALEVLSDYVRDTRFSVDRGFFSVPFSVSITCDTPGAEIRYTTDNSVPEAATGTRYTVPVSITTTTVLRARAFKSGLVPSNVDTQSYIFAAAWKAQPALPAGFSSTWGQAAAPFTFLKNSAVYRMHTTITNHAEYGPLIIPALTQTLPVICITGNRAELLGDSGLYGDLRYSDAEMPVGVEYFDPLNASVRFTARGALQIHGGAARDHAKKAFRLDFTGAFGEGPLRFPLFAGSKSEKFDQLVLRPGGHDSFGAPGRDQNINNLDLAYHASYLRDQFLRRTENVAGLLSPRGRYVHLCLNGLYWGLYDLHERPAAEFCVANSGGDTAAWDVLHHNNISSSSGPQVVDGGAEAWNALQALTTNPVTTNAAYQQLASLLGPDRFIDHLLIRMWSGDYDWLGPAYDPNIVQNVSAFFTKNWYAVRDTRAPVPGTWQFFTWDAEICMGSHMLPELLNTSRTDIVWPSYLLRKLDLDLTRISRAGTPAAPWAALKAHPEFRLRVADRARRLLDGNGALAPAVAAARLQSMISELELPIVAESARWAAVCGNRAGRGAGNWTSSPVMTRNDHWRPEVEWLRDTFIVQRREIFRSQLRAQSLYPVVAPVEIAPFGGNAGSADPITLTAAAGTIFYTTDGSDPRAPLSGFAAGMEYTAPLTTGGVSPFTVKARALDGSEWSALTEVTFSTAAQPAPGSLAVTQLHYHPPEPSEQEAAQGFTDADLFEFLQITNVSGQTLDLTGLRFAAGLDFDFAAHSSRRELAPGAFVVLCSHGGAFQARYGVAPDGVFAGGTRLANNGERLKLVRRDGVVIFEFSYNDAGNWPAAADGGGAALHLLAPASGTDPGEADNWRADLPAPAAGPAAVLSYDTWRGDFFTPREISAGLGDPLADADGDRLVNLVEYATKSNPRRTSQPPVTVSFPGPGKVRFSCERRAGLAGYTLVLGVSSAMTSWPGVSPSATLATDNATEELVFDLDLPASGRLFARLMVSPSP